MHQKAIEHLIYEIELLERDYIPHRQKALENARFELDRAETSLEDAQIRANEFRKTLEFLRNAEED